MSDLNRVPPNNLRKFIREFEDRKISAALLGREVQLVAQSIQEDSEATLRRSLERHGNRLIVLAERGLGSQVHSEVLEVVDEIVSDLVDWGY